MPQTDNVTPNLHGRYHDVLRDASGRMLWDSGRRSNTIVINCRRLLAGLMRRAPNTLGIQALHVGAGDANWDRQATLPPSDPNRTALVDPHPLVFPLDQPQFDYLEIDSDNVSNTPTSKLRVIARLGPNTPPWPDANHPTSTLREFGLVGGLDGNTVLINYVAHPAIVKDPTSTLERTIWLVF